MKSTTEHLEYMRQYGREAAQAVGVEPTDNRKKYGLPDQALVYLTKKHGPHFYTGALAAFAEGYKGAFEQDA